MTYENETCEGCVHYIGGFGCEKADEIEDWASTPACKHFTPSLECRKVRALEEVARLMRGPVEMIEDIHSALPRSLMSLT